MNDTKQIDEIVKFRRLRTKYAITMRDYSTIRGMSPSWLHKIESGVTKWNPNELKILKEYAKYIEKPLKRGFHIDREQFDRYLKSDECTHINLYRLRMKWHNIRPLEFKEASFKKLKMSFEEFITN